MNNNDNENVKHRCRSSRGGKKNSFDKLNINTCGKRTLGYYKVLTQKNIAGKESKKSNFLSIPRGFFISLYYYLPTI